MPTHADDTSRQPGRQDRGGSMNFARPMMIPLYIVISSPSSSSPPPPATSFIAKINTPHTSERHDVRRPPPRSRLRRVRQWCHRRGFVVVVYPVIVVVVIFPVVVIVVVVVVIVVVVDVVAAAIRGMHLSQVNTVLPHRTGHRVLLLLRGPVPPPPRRVRQRLAPVRRIVRRHPDAGPPPPLAVPAGGQVRHRAMRAGRGEGVLPLRGARSVPAGRGGQEECGCVDHVPDQQAGNARRHGEGEGERERERERGRERLSRAPSLIGATRPRIRRSRIPAPPLLLEEE
jgi:hypothetical protein